MSHSTEDSIAADTKKHIANVSVIAVTFNSASVIGDMIASIPNSVSILVVDNGSSDLEELKKVCSVRDTVRLIPLDKNTGFGSACNVGAGLATTPFLFFVNPDAQLGQSVIEELLTAVQRYPERSVFNPRILHSDGRTNLRAPSRFDGRAPGSAAANPDGDIPLSILSGAAIFMQRAHFQELGGFDQEIFLFFEDDDLSLRLRNAGFELHHIHAATVVHGGGTSTAPSPQLTSFKNYHWMKSYAYVSKKHGYPFRKIRLTLLSGWRWIIALITANAGERHKYEGRLKALLSL